MGDLENVGGALAAVILVSALSGSAFGSSSSSSSSSSTTGTTTSSTTNIGSQTSGSSCTTSHSMGSQTVRLNGITMATVTQYYGTCDGAARNWAVLQFSDTAMSDYSTQGSVAIIRRDGTGRTVGAVSDESTARISSTPVATASTCTAATGTVTVVRLSDGRRFGPVTVSTAKRC